MSNRTVKVILEANATGLIAGFRAAKGEVASFSASATKNSQAMDDMGRKAAGMGTQTSAGAATAAASMSQLSGATKGTYGAVNTLGSGMKAGAGSINTLSTATLAARGGLSTLGQTAVTQSSLASGGLKTMGGAAQSAGAAAAAASGGLRTLGSSATNAGKGTLVASGGLKAAGSSAAGISTNAAAAAGGLKAVSSSAAGVSSGAMAASGGLKAVGSSAAGVGSGANAAASGLNAVGSSAAGVSKGATAAAGGLDGVGSAAKGASSNATAAATGFGRLSGSIRENNSAWSDLSTKAMIGGAAIVGGLGMATKAAISWESAWAGVQKTNDGNAQQMAKLEGELRNLAKTLPASHQEIAAVAEAAGQLGIERENVASFTKTMIDMGESTNLSAEDAATAIARFSNVMGTAQTDVDKIGSSIVGLGNNFATTESEIVQMSLRLTGAGRQANMTEGDILGMATALSSVGIEAQAGGTAMSRVITEMGKSVDTGNDKLETFAKTAGMSSEAFAKLWRENSGEAMQRFIAGLGEMQARGESLEPTLQALGMTDIRVGDALRRSASAADQFGDAMATGNKEFDKGSALAEEASKRYATTESRMRIAMNSIKDAAIDLGSVIGPALAKVAEGAAGMANAFVQLPGPVRNAVTGIAGFTGATLLIGGATVKAISGLQSLRDTLDQVGLLTPRVEKGLGAVGRAAVGLGAVLVGVAALNKLDSAFQAAAPSANDLSDALDKVASSGSMKSLNSEFQRFFDQTSTHKALFGDMSSDIKGVGEAVAYLNDKGKVRGFLDWKNDLIGLESESKKAKDGLAEMDKVLTQLLQQDPARGREVWRGLVEDAKKAGVSVKELEAAFPGAVAAMKEADRSAKENGAATAEMAEQMADAEQAADDLSDAIKGLGDTLLGQQSAEIGYKASLDDATKALKENGATLDINTEKGRANKEALIDVAESAQDYAAAVFESTGSVEKAQGVLDRGRKSYIDMAVSMGMGREEAKALADELFQIPDDVSTEFEAKGADEAKQKTTDWKGVLTGIPSDKRTNISAPGASESKAKVLELGTSITNLDGKTVKVTEDGAQSSQVRVRELDGTLVGLPSSKKVQVTEVGSTAAGEMVVQFKDKVFAIPKSKTTQIREQGSGNAKANVMGLNESIKLLNGKTVKVGEDGAQKAKGRVVELDGSIFGLKGKTVEVKEIGATASGDRVVQFDGKIYRLKGKTVEVKEQGASDSKSRVDLLRGAIGSVYGKNMDVRANVHGKWDVDGLRNSINSTHSKTVTVTAVRRIKNMFADGGLLVGGVQTFADGGFASIGSQPPQIRVAGGAGITWAEAGAGPWEAFISGHPAKSARSKQIWLETGRRLGMLEAHADGAVRQYARPAPPARHYVAPQPRVQVQAPAPAAVASGPSTAEMQAAFASAMSTMRPVVQIGGRDFYGVMQRTANDRKGRG